jgi:hypothetical protein
MAAVKNSVQSGEGNLSQAREMAGGGRAGLEKGRQEVLESAGRPRAQLRVRQRQVQRHHRLVACRDLRHL